MNILFLSSQPSRRYGGPVNWMRHLIAALRELGHRVYVVSWGPRPPEAVSAGGPGDAAWGPDWQTVPLNRSLVALPFVGFSYQLLAAARVCRRLLDRAGIDAIHTLTVYEAYSASLARRDGPQAIVLSLHGDYVTEQNEWWKSRWRRRLHMPLERRGLRACQALTTSSLWLQSVLAEELRDFGELSRAGRPAVVIPNGIVVPPAGLPVADLAALGLPPGARIVLTLNSLHAPYRRQGLRLLIDAAPAVLRHFPDTVFLVVGGVNEPKRDRELVTWAAVQAGDLPFRFTGFRRQAPLDLMAAADLYVHPSFLDNSPTAVMEAMALGKPIVATSIGGIPELVSDGETGLLVPTEPDSLANALIRLLAAPGYGQELGRRARERAVRDFAWDRVGRAFADLYGEAAEARRRGRAARPLHVGRVSMPGRDRT